MRFTDPFIVLCCDRPLAGSKMRRVAVTFLKAGATARSFASSTGVEPAGSSGTLQKIYLGLQITGGLIAVIGTVGAGGYALHTVDAKLAAMSTKVEGALLTVDAKVAGIKETVTKEVDAKVAGVEKSVDAKVAGVEKGVDAKVASMADKAKAEALMVLKDYGVSDVECPLVVERQAHPNPTPTTDDLCKSLSLAPSLFAGVGRRRPGQQVGHEATQTGTVSTVVNDYDVSDVVSPLVSARGGSVNRCL
jgi:hypothetical protein